MYLKKLNSSNKPIVILANTIKGKGLYKFENTLHSHYFSIENKEMLNRLIDNLKWETYLFINLVKELKKTKM